MSNGALIQKPFVVKENDECGAQKHLGIQLWEELELHLYVIDAKAQLKKDQFVRR